MSCDRRCFDPESVHYEHDDCSTCPGADRGPGVTLLSFARMVAPDERREPRSNPDERRIGWLCDCKPGGMECEGCRRNRESRERAAAPTAGTYKPPHGGYPG